MRSLAVMAQPLDIDDSHPAIFEPEQALLLQSLQALIGILPRHSGQRPDLLLGDLEVTREVGIEDGVEQRSDRTRQPCRRIQRAAVLEQPDELAETLVELPYQETVEPHAVLEQPEERAAVHHRQTRIAQRHHVVAAGLLLQHRAFAEPCPGGEAGKTGGLAAARHDAHPGKSRDHAGPVIEMIAAHENEFVGAIGFLGDAGARDLDLALIEFARPGRDALEVFRRNHDPGDRRSVRVPALMLRRNMTSAGTRFNESREMKWLTNFAGQLSGKRHSKLSYCPMESHFARRGSRHRRGAALPRITPG